MSSNYYDQAKSMGSSAMQSMGNAAHGAAKYVPKAPPMHTGPISTMVQGDCPKPHITYYIFMFILLVIFGSSFVLTMNSIMDTSDTTAIYQILSSVAILIFCLVILYYSG